MKTNKIGVLAIVCMLHISGCAQADNEKREAIKTVSIVLLEEGGVTAHKLKGDSSVVSAINSEISVLVDSYKCENGGDYSFTSSTPFLSKKYFSFKFEANFYCDGMASPEGIVAGAVFDMKSGTVVPIDKFLEAEKLSISEVDVLKKVRELKSAEDCPQPQFSGQYYLTSDSIVFIEFYPDNLYEHCEVDVRVSLR